MNLQRKEIILKEIEYWKKHRLLPEQYCNYLLTLYSEGEHEIKGTQRSLNAKGLLAFLPILFLILLPIIFLVLYFTEMSFGLQMTLNFILITITVAFCFYSYKKNQLYHTFFLIFSFLLFFVNSIEIMDYFFGNSPIVFGATILFHCLLWFIAGNKFELNILKISGALGILLLFGYMATQFYI